MNPSSSEGHKVTHGENGPGPLSEARSWVIISVHDEGIGVPAEQLPKIFQQFYQVSPKLGIRTGGIGVGLYICRGYVEAMGGRIWAESEEGKGSTFSFILPAVAFAPEFPSRPLRSRADVGDQVEV